MLQREDFVQNSNDSAWLSNPASPLTGYSPLVSREGRELSPRARFALGRLQGDAPLGADVLQALVTDNEVGLATGLLPELLALCKTEAGNAGLAAPCKALAAWDGKANLESGIGFLHFQHFMQAFAGIGNGWREPFDPQRPTVTPRGLNPAARGEVIQALVTAGEEVARAGIPEQARWGDIQRAGAIGIPGGDGHFGVYNAMQSELQGDHLEVVSGTSYLQLVTFDGEGPQARGLLAFSQSSEAGSPHHSDQTELFARQQWQKLPFTNAEIEADPELERKVLRVK